MAIVGIVISFAWLLCHPSGGGAAAAPGHETDLGCKATGALESESTPLLPKRQLTTNRKD